MKTRVQKWGNSLAVRIPSSYATDLHLDRGSEVELVLEERSLRLTPTDDQAALMDLLQRVTPENRHDESEPDAPMGREVF